MTSVYFRNFDVFDGRSEKLLSRRHVLVKENRITKLSREPIDPPEGCKIFEGEDSVLMPGLIDVHFHAFLSQPIPKLLESSATYVGVTAVRALEATLQRGFTTVRDAAGADYGIVMALREGLVEGPRIYPSGRGLSQTGGHGDMRGLHVSRSGPTSAGAGLQDLAIAIADGVDEVLYAAREELRRGATQIKIMAGGGVISPADPIHSVQYSPEEVRAAVDVAENWDTYVLAHAYTPRAIRQCLENGVLSIEHGNLIDRECAALAAEKGAFVNPNLVTYWAMEQTSDMPDLYRAKNREVWEGAQRELEYLKQAGTKIGFGTDLVGPAHVLQSKEFGLRTQVFSPFEVLRQATSLSAELLSHCGKLNPYGRLGVVEEGAMADLLIVKGNPLENVGVLEDPAKNICLIMRDGAIVKNTLSNM